MHANATHEFSPDQQVSGCTVAIQSGRWSGQGLAWACVALAFGLLITIIWIALLIWLPVNLVTPTIVKVFSNIVW